MEKDIRKDLKPDFIFEISWEVCNKVGGIHTVISTKAKSMIENFQNNYIVIGPDVIKDESGNPEFQEGIHLYSAWHKQAETEGLSIRIGRWKINGYPIAILINFSQIINQKDKIFAELWEKYRLDSLSGQWDYIEPALFGYAAGKVIESFVKYNLTISDRPVAIFHEWMTGCGILYLKDKVPQVGTVFVTHATVLGRALAANNKKLYKNLTTFNPDEVAREFNLVSKYSLEKLSAQHADVFTTVSSITAKECIHFLFREPYPITPNGFEDSIIPADDELEIKRKKSKELLKKIADTLLPGGCPENSFIVGISGRYEFKNKGIDLFIESLGRLNKFVNPCKTIIGFLFIPANHYGPRKDLISKLNNPQENITGSPYLTHELHEPEWDMILNKIKEVGLLNKPEDHVKVIYVPSYLNGNDGIFNCHYYDILLGLDLTIFPSYYEPWGYTPLESLAFSVPTITTTLAGFGRWVKEKYGDSESTFVIERNDDNDNEVIDKIVESIIKICSCNNIKIERIRNEALKLAKTALWNNLIRHYILAFQIALEKIDMRADKFTEIESKQTELVHNQITVFANEPVLKKVRVQLRFPENLIPFKELIENLWWTWNDDAYELFEQIDEKLWQECDQNPVVFFQKINYEKLKQLNEDKNFVRKLNKVVSNFNEYMSEKPKGIKIAYFSMEFGIHPSLKTYAGGLGVLAGDFLKQASDSCADIVGVGLLYRYGYLNQLITATGEQQSSFDYQHFSYLPIKPVKDENNDFKLVTIIFPGRTLYARIWEVNVGRIKLYLLDTDFDANVPEDRTITYHLYGGDIENRLKQELLLGVGGVRALDLMGIKPDIYHSNEGHSAFIGLERIRKYIQNEKLTFGEAKEIVRASTVFTTHTPVPAGHDEFEETLLRKYVGHYADRLKITWDEFMSLGRANPNDWNAKFNMSFLAAHLAQEVNAVSLLHCAVTRQIFSKLWPGFLIDELHVKFVTNGVHYDTWTSPEFKNLYKSTLGKKFTDVKDVREYQKIYEIPDEVIWRIKFSLKKKLIEKIKDRLKNTWIKQHEDPKLLIQITNTLNEKVLTIVFARRFATYKRAYLLFKDLDRLSKIVNNPSMPVQFIFAGKAHPNDRAGIEMIKTIVQISKRPEFVGKIIFLQNYDIYLAKLLVQGADIWLNTPVRPLEASGTSGQKAVLNGTLHFSVLDGWWVEGYVPEAGWALTNETTYQDQNLQDDLDAEYIYTTLEKEVIPMFYNRNNDNIPVDWIQYIKNSIINIAPRFTTQRMIDDYYEKIYNKLYERYLLVIDNDYEKAKELASWKKRIMRSWNNIEVLEKNIFGSEISELMMGKSYEGKVVLDLNEVSVNDIKLELVLMSENNSKIDIIPFKLEKYEIDKATYKINISIKEPGSFQYGIRILPYHPLLPHAQDFPIVRWI